MYSILLLYVTLTLTLIYVTLIYATLTLTLIYATLIYVTLTLIYATLIYVTLTLTLTLIYVTLAGAEPAELLLLGLSIHQLIATGKWTARELVRAGATLSDLRLAGMHTGIQYI